MKLKLLLFSLFLASTVVHAQNDTIRSLVITEWQSGGDVGVYHEITNVGNEPIQIGDFKYAKISPYVAEPIIDVFNDPWYSEGYYFLPEQMLQPGESYVITAAVDFGPAQYRKKVAGFEGNEREKNPDWYEIADLLIHWGEYKSTAADIDSATTAIPGSRRWDNIPGTLASWRGRSGYYLEQHFPSGDSVVVDQVNGVFANNGFNEDTPNGIEGYDVAGVEGASASHILVRKFSVKSGNPDFANARGIDLEDSEWMPIPKQDGEWRDIYWTVGNHGDYNLDENTLESDVIDVDFDNKTLTVPWGIRRGDGIMRNMVKKPGVAWEYHLNPNAEDSLTFAAKTGDQLTIYVCGTDLDVETFDIVVAEPTEDANIVVPVANRDNGGWWRRAISRGAEAYGWPRVTQHENGTDTITGTWFGLPFATRIDSLMERLEVADNASVEFNFVDGIERPDLKDGDQLKVIAANGGTKTYHIQVQPYEASHNANLASITWPDIPDFYRGIFGWIGDTIPNFGPQVYNYRVQVPFDVEGIPALIAKPEGLNAQVDVKRAASLTGTVEDRTVEYRVTAEDDSVKNVYSIELVKEKNMQDLQPFEADPFISEVVYADQWANFFTEIFNPGNQILDLSDYMIASNWTNDPISAITWNTAEGDWMNRYTKYIPGYKWVDESQWNVSPAMLEPDLNVSPYVQPGDVFVLGSIGNDGQTKHPNFLGQYWWVPDQLDVQFRNSGGYTNNWGEATGATTAAGNWMGSGLFLFKILNDSIKQGLKPANDPNDFELIDILAMQDGSGWVLQDGWNIGRMTANIIRKPEYYDGNAEIESSFGNLDGENEWLHFDRPYWQAQNVGYPQDILYDAADLGKHYFISPTHYMSTVSSVVYKVSEGYSMNEQIRGVVTGTTVADFFGNIIKPNEDQMLKIKGTADGSELAMDATLTMNDTLVVVSADSVNTSKYLIEVTDDGLNSNAVLTSVKYDIVINDEPMAVTENAGTQDHHMRTGSISGFEYGTQLKTVVDNVIVPAGANLTIVNEDGSYVPLTMLNYDTMYVSVTVNHNTYFEVVAEDGITTIVYQLLPETSPSDAFITSDIYSVDQRQLLIEFIPRGTSAQELLSNLVPSLGATVKLTDKSGLERTMGQVVQDDRIVVTSPDGTIQNVYYLSMLRSEFVPETTYLAYVTSNVYDVNQMGMVISGVTNTTEVATFYNRIDPAMGATAMVVDADGNEKTGTLAYGDMLKVVSADDKYTVMYTFDINTSSGVTQEINLNLYPNPTNGEVTISGVAIGGRIQVFNSTGSQISDTNVQSSIETISLSNQPAGMYLIVVSDDSKKLGQFKVLRR